VKKEEFEGQTAVLVSIDDEIKGVVSIADDIR
jgi:cation transport ATPase